MLIEALFRAAGTGDVGRVRELLAAGADANSVDPLYGHTALYAACFADQEMTVRALLEGGADPNLRFTYLSPVDGRREGNVVALMYAHSVPVVAALLEAGADVNATDDEGSTPLMRAVLIAAPAVVRMLSEGGADARAIDRRGRSAEDVVDERAALVKRRRRFIDKELYQRRMEELETIRALLLNPVRECPGKH